MSEEMNKKVEIVRSFFKKEQPKNHPIKDHPLEKCEEYTKNLYVDMLCVFAMYDNDDTENQFNFIQRIMSGIEDTLSINDHIKRAMEVNVDKVGEFIKQIQDNDIKGIFFTDALIISCANGSPTKKQTEFLAEFADTIGFEKKTISFLSKMVVSILEGNSDKLNECANECEDIGKYVESAMCYLKTNLEKILLSCDGTVYWHLKSQDKIEQLADNYQFKNLDSVVLESIVIDKNISFSAVKTVRIENCIFEENRNGPVLAFSGVETVIIDKCIFRNLAKVLNFITKPSVANITNSLFENCSALSGDKEAVIITSTGADIKFENTVFKNIYNSYSDRSYDHVVISYGNNIEISNCEFYDCTWYYTWRGENGMFYPQPKGKDNKYIGCRYLS